MQMKDAGKADPVRAMPGGIPLKTERSEAGKTSRVTAKTAPRPLIQPRLWVALFCIMGVVIAGSLYRVTRLYQTTSAQAEKLRADLAEELEVQSDLTHERDYKSTNTYIERAARIEYGFMYPGDIRFVAQLEPYESDSDSSANHDAEDPEEDWDTSELGDVVSAFAQGGGE